MRIRYNQQKYDSVFNDASKSLLTKSVENVSLLKLIEAWLERTPCLVSHRIDKEGKRKEINFFLLEFQKGFNSYLQDNFLDPIEVENYIVTVFCLLK